MILFEVGCFSNSNCGHNSSTICLRHILDKVKLLHFHITSNEVMWPKTILDYMQRLKNGPALLVLSSKFSHRISKILFALGVDEFLAMLEGKIREAPFF